MKKKCLFVILVMFLMTTLFYTAYNSHAHIIRMSYARALAAMPVGEEAAMPIGRDFDMGLSCCCHYTFENKIRMATDVVVVEFVARKPFAQYATEYEFIVHDRIFGDAADTIFVYAIYDEMGFQFARTGFQFTTDTLYLLPLIKLNNIYSRVHYDGFMFTSTLMLDLNDPSGSTIHGMPLSLYSDINFNSRGLTKESIISYVRTLPRRPFPTVNRVFITTDDLVDIIDGSPYVLVIEITEPVRMASEARRSDITSTDIYLTTVVEVLRGDLQVGDTVQVSFFAGTVFPGETHIVSVSPLCFCCRSPHYQIFTSRHSLHCVDQRDEIMSIINPPRRPSTGGNAGTWEESPAETPRPSPSPTPSPAPALTQAEASSRFSATLYDPDEAGDIELINIEVDLPEDFLTAMLQRDDLNTMFLKEEMHNIAVMADGEIADDTLTIVSVYVGDLNLTDKQLLMLRGFSINPTTGAYTTIPGHFTPERNYFNFEFQGQGTIGALIHDLPTPLLRLTINQYRYYYRGTPQTSDAAPFITQDRTMVPIRLVSEALGATPRWDGATRTAYIYYNETILRLPVDHPLPGNMGTPVMRNNRVLVPLRFVIENFEAFTFWNGEYSEVTVFVLE